MTSQEILKRLQRDIHTVVFATVDEKGLPQTCVIDLMLADEGGLYFLTARGKAFYGRLMQKKYAALSGRKGEDTLSSIAISVRGPVRPIGQELSLIHIYIHPATARSSASIAVHPHV